MEASRRMGPAGSPTWLAMVEAAEAILRKDGHAKLSSRSVAEEIGVKQRLVYYYFETMDDLIVATFRSLAARELERLQAALASGQPVREIWNVCIHTSDARLIAEFTAVANRIDLLRDEVIAYIETTRRLQIAALSEAPGFAKAFGTLPPSVVATLATSLALSLTREAQLGVAIGHAETNAAIEALLKLVESR